MNMTFWCFAWSFTAGPLYLSFASTYRSEFEWWVHFPIKQLLTFTLAASWTKATCLRHYP